jgi:hypothetical protein
MKGKKNTHQLVLKMCKAGRVKENVNTARKKPFLIEKPDPRD